MSKKTIKTKISPITELNQEDIQWLRQSSVNLAIKLFAETPFKNMLGSTVLQSIITQVSDVPFYQTVNEIYAFLKDGEFPGLIKFEAEQEAKKAA